MYCTGKELLPRERHLLPLRRVIVPFLFVSSLHLCDGEFRLCRSFTTDDFIQGQLITHSQTNWTIPDCVPRQITAGWTVQSDTNVSQNMWHHSFLCIKTSYTECYREWFFFSPCVRQQRWQMVITILGISIDEAQPTMVTLAIFFSFIIFTCKLIIMCYCRVIRQPRAYLDRRLECHLTSAETEGLRCCWNKIPSSW